MISLQFITHQTERYSYFESARMALEGGCKWIQLRMKEAPLEEVEQVALQLKPLCKEHEAILVLDDHVELVARPIPSRMSYNITAPEPITWGSVPSASPPLKRI